MFLQSTQPFGQLRVGGRDRMRMAAYMPFASWLIKDSLNARMNQAGPLAAKARATAGFRGAGLRLT